MSGGAACPLESTDGVRQGKVTPADRKVARPPSFSTWKSRLVDLVWVHLISCSFVVVVCMLQTTVEKYLFCFSKGYEDCVILGKRDVFPEVVCWFLPFLRIRTCRVLSCLATGPLTAGNVPIWISSDEIGLSLNGFVNSLWLHKKQWVYINDSCIITLWIQPCMW